MSKQENEEAMPERGAEQLLMQVILVDSSPATYSEWQGLSGQLWLTHSQPLVASGWGLVNQDYLHHKLFGA